MKTWTDEETNRWMNGRTMDKRMDSPETREQSSTLFINMTEETLPHSSVQWQGQTSTLKLRLLNSKPSILLRHTKDIDLNIVSSSSLWEKKSFNFTCVCRFCSCGKILSLTLNVLIFYLLITVTSLLLHLSSFNMVLSGICISQTNSLPFPKLP